MWYSYGTLSQPTTEFKEKKPIFRDNAGRFNKITPKFLTKHQKRAILVSVIRRCGGIGRHRGLKIPR